MAPTLSVHLRPLRSEESYFQHLTLETSMGAQAILNAICKKVVEEEGFLDCVGLDYVSLTYYTTQGKSAKKYLPPPLVVSYVNFRNIPVINDIIGSTRKNILFAVLDMLEVDDTNAVVTVMPAILVKVGNNPIKPFSFADAQGRWHAMVEESLKNGHKGLVISGITEDTDTGKGVGGAGAAAGGGGKGAKGKAKGEGAGGEVTLGGVVKVEGETKGEGGGGEVKVEGGGGEVKVEDGAAGKGPKREADGGQEDPVKHQRHT